MYTHELTSHDITISIFDESFPKLKNNWWHANEDDVVNIWS